METTDEELVCCNVSSSDYNQLDYVCDNCIERYLQDEIDRAIDRHNEDMRGGI